MKPLRFTTSWWRPSKDLDTFGLVKFFSLPGFIVILIFTAILTVFLLVRWLYHGRARRSAAWDCGFPAQTARMQDTAEGFGQPVRQVFESPQDEMPPVICPVSLSTTRGMTRGSPSCSGSVESLP